MASYAAWNKALSVYFTAGIPKGSPVFLSVDDEVLEELATGDFLDEVAGENPVSDFIEAVRRQCVLPHGNSVSFRNLRTSIGKVPGGVAFLALLVYSAHQMQADGSIDESNYFLRLRETLGFPGLHGRPDGLMPPGVEEILWSEWNQWLERAGFQKTAERGDGPMKYLQYIISQAILRESDKQYLRQYFRDNHPPPDLDSSQLIFWLSRQRLRRHLEDGLRHPDPRRTLEFGRAAHRVYEAGSWTKDSQRRVGSFRTANRGIECGLFREESGWQSDVTYWAFPKQPERVKSRPIKATVPGEAEPKPLRQLREGFFRPFWKQHPFVDAVIESDVIGDPGILKIRFPNRDFWVLTREPDNPAGAWANWKPYPDLDEQFLLLCRPGLFENEMRRFREAKLLQWILRTEQEGWVEYQNCMILSFDWFSFIPSNERCRALVYELTPRAMAGVSLQGGFRDPNQNAWLEGYPPTMKIYGFQHEFTVAVTGSGGQEVMRKNTVCQEEIALPDDLKADTYKIEAKWNGRHMAGRFMRIAPWNTMEEHPDPEMIVNSWAVAAAGFRLRGAMPMDKSAISK